MHNFSFQKAAAASIMIMASAGMASAQCYLQSIDPANGSDVQVLESVEMVWKTPSGGNPDFGGEKGFWNYSNACKLPVIKDGAQQVARMNVMQLMDYTTTPWGMTYKGVIIGNDDVDPRSLTDPGTYTIVIPAGMFTSDDWNADPNEALTLNYTIGGGGGGGDVTPDEPVDKSVCYLDGSNPASGSVVESIGDVSMYWMDPDTAYPDFSSEIWDSYYGGDGGIVNLLDKDGNVARSAKVRQNAWGSPKSYDVTFDPIVTEPGQYTLVIPAGMFVEDGTGNYPSKETKLRFTIEGNGSGDDQPGDYTTDFNYVTVYPAQGNIRFVDGKSLYRLNITFPDIVSVNPAKKVYVEKPNGTTVNADMHTTSAGIGMPKVFITGFNDAEDWPSGQYTVVIPEATVGSEEWAASGYKSGSCNQETRIVYNYTEDPNKVYDLDDGSEFKVNAAWIEKANGQMLVDLTGDNLSLASIPGGSKLFFDTNKNDICMDAYFTITDVTANEVQWLAGTFRQQVTSETDIRTLNGKNADGVFEMETMARYNIELIEGHDYEVKMEVYLKYDGVAEALRVQKGEANYYIKGTTPAYQYADVKIVDINPNPDYAEIEDAANAKFTVTFSAPVTMDESRTTCQNDMGAWVAYASCQTIDDGTTWEFVIPNAVAAGAKGQIECGLAPRVDGKALWVEEGEGYKAIYSVYSKDATVQRFSLPCFLGGNSIEVSPAAGVVESLETFKFTANTAAYRNIGFQGVNASGGLVNAILYKDGVEVARMVRESVGEESGEYVISETMHLDKKITDAGEYTLKVPGAYFMTGTESSSYANRPMSFVYTIEGVEVENFQVGAFNLANDQKHSHLSVVHTSVAGAATAAEGAAFVLKEGNETVATAPVIAHVTGDKTMVYGHFDNVATNAASYTVELPEGSLLSGDSKNAAASVNFSGVGASAEPEMVTVTLMIDNYATVAHNAVKGQPYMMMLMNDMNWVLDALYVNGTDVTDDVAFGMYDIPAENMTSDVELEAYYKFAHDVDFDFTDGVEEVAGCDYVVRSNGGSIVISNLVAGDEINVYTPNGMRIAGTTASKDVAAITVAHGVYIVMINNKSLKINHNN